MQYNFEVKPVSSYILNSNSIKYLPQNLRIPMNDEDRFSVAYEGKDVIEMKYNTFLENMNRKKICCIYAYYEKDENSKNALIFFLENGIYDEIDYYFVINGPQCSVDFNPIMNFKNNIIVYQRENKGFDFGAWSHALKNMKYKKYDYYAFLNTSVIGPYLHNKHDKWYYHFIKLFRENVKIVGTTINIYDCKYKISPFADKSMPHVQSMFFIIDQEYMDHLISINFFDENKINQITNILEIIINYELQISMIALQKGWNINCLLEPFRNQNYLNFKYIFPDYLKNDKYFPNRYFGKSIEPHQVIFWKYNRFL